jgi:hypothetical protein
VISGGLPVTGWRLVDRARNLRAAPAPAGLDSTRQLYVNGVRAQRTSGRPPVGLTVDEVPVTFTNPDGTTAPGTITGDGAVSIHFKHPVQGDTGSDGGSPVVSFTITASPGGRTLTVTANNAAGSNASVTVSATPAASPPQ